MKTRFLSPHLTPAAILLLWHLAEGIYLTLTKEQSHFYPIIMWNHIWNNQHNWQRWPRVCCQRSLEPESVKVKTKWKVSFSVLSATFHMLSRYMYWTMEEHPITAESSSKQSDPDFEMRDWAKLAIAHSSTLFWTGFTSMQYVSKEREMKLR